MSSNKPQKKKGEGVSRNQNIKPEIRNLIIRYLSEHNDTYRQDPELAIYLDVKQGGRNIDDWLKLLYEQGDLFQWKEGRVLKYRLKNRELILEQLLEQKNAQEISEAIEYLTTGESDNFMNDFKRVFSANRGVVHGHLNIIESLNSEKLSHYFEDLKQAIEERKYLLVTVKLPKQERFENVKPIQLLFLDNNWYIFMEYQNFGSDPIARLIRLSFISEIQYLAENKYSNKNTFQKKELEKYDDFLNEIQNANSQYNLPKKIARIRANKGIAHYFDKGMKKFLTSQEFKIKNEDGSIEFELTYTTDLEVLRFIQSWLPDLVILSPLELKENYKSKLQTAIKNL